MTLSGDAQSFETLYDRLQGGIYRYALRMTGSPATAEDVTQEVFLSLIRDRCEYEERRGAVKSYLYGMARHRLMRRLKRERTFVPLETSDRESASTDPFLSIVRDETVDMVRQAVLSLPEHFREVVVLCDLQEMNYAEAGEIIDCPIGTVRSRLARARSLLVRKLGILNTPATTPTNIQVLKAT